MILRIGNKNRPKTKDHRLKTSFVLHRFHGLWSMVYGLNKGLTLVEVLLAVSILALGIVGVLRGYASSITTLEAGQYNVDAVNLLKKKMGELEIMLKEEEKIILEGERGVFEEPFKDFSWEWAIKPTATEELYTLSLVVSSEIDPRTVELNTYVADKEDEEEE